MLSTYPNTLPHKERKSFPLEVVEEAFYIVVEEDVRQEKN